MALEGDFSPIIETKQIPVLYLETKHLAVAGCSQAAENKQAAGERREKRTVQD